jgi:hypothetical protein
LSRRVPLCELCGDREAEFVCRECGKLVCRFDFDLTYRVCRDCVDRLGLVGEPLEGGVWSLFSPYILITLGMLLIFIGFIVSTLGLLNFSGNVINDLVVVLWPFPILLTGSTGLAVGILYIVIIILFLILFWRFLSR